MARSLFDQLLGSLNSATTTPQQPGRSGDAGGIGGILSQLSGSMGGGRGSQGSGGGLSDILGQLQGSLGMGQSSGNTGGMGGLDGMMGDRHSFAKGAAAGGLMGALLGGRGTVKTAGVAVIGTLAWRAYQNWKAQQAADPQMHVPALANQASAQDFMPTQDNADDLSEKLARAMVAAAKADGQVTAMERRRIVDALTDRGFGDQARQLVEEELDGPLDLDHVAALATTPEEAAQIYTASLLAVDPEGAAERAYLRSLASKLRLDEAFVHHLHDQAGAAA